MLEVVVESESGEETKYKIGNSGAILKQSGKGEQATSYNLNETVMGCVLPHEDAEGLEDKSGKLYRPGSASRDLKKGYHMVIMAEGGPYVSDDKIKSVEKVD